MNELPGKDLSADLLADLPSFTEGGRDLGFNVGGSLLLRDDISQQVDENLVILQERHAAVLGVKGQIGPQLSNGHMDLTWVLTLARLQIKARQSGSWSLRKELASN